MPLSNAVGPALRKAGGFIVPEVLSVENTAVPSASGKSLNVVRVSVKYSVFGTEGEPIVGIIVAEAFDSGDKATAKAMSVAYRTFLLQLLCLPTDEPDPDHDSYEIGKLDVGALVDWAEVVKAQPLRLNSRPLGSRLHRLVWLMFASTAQP
jgi:hypothetical protein